MSLPKFKKRAGKKRLSDIIKVTRVATADKAALNKYLQKHGMDAESFAKVLQELLDENGFNDTNMITSYSSEDSGTVVWSQEVEEPKTDK
jgi:SOS response regulatory protein OraA/RecX